MMFIALRAAVINADGARADALMRGGARLGEYDTIDVINYCRNPAVRALADGAMMPPEAVMEAAAQRVQRDTAAAHFAWTAEEQVTARFYAAVDAADQMLIAARIGHHDGVRAALAALAAPPGARGDIDAAIAAAARGERPPRAMHALAARKALEEDRRHEGQPSFGASNHYSKYYKRVRERRSYARQRDKLVALLRGPLAPLLPHGADPAAAPADRDEFARWLGALADAARAAGDAGALADRLDHVAFSVRCYDTDIGCIAAMVV